MSQPFVEPCNPGIIGAEPCPRELGREIPRTTRSWILAACVLSSSMAFIDGSALTVALPALRADLNADLATVQWVLNGYVLALAALTVIGGGLGGRLWQGSYACTRQCRIWSCIDYVRGRSNDRMAHICAHRSGYRSCGPDTRKPCLDRSGISKGGTQ